MHFQTMKTTRIILQVPFYKHPAGTVFDVDQNAQPADWPEDERVREKQNFSSKTAWLLPDGGRGFAVNLPVSDTVICPDHVFAGEDTRRGPCRATLIETLHDDGVPQQNMAPPCGRLQEKDVELKQNETLHSQTLVIQLPPFEHVAEKMVLLDKLTNKTVIEYILRNYKDSDTQLTWDVSDLNPGFYELRICFPKGWYHCIRFIKFYPRYIDIAKIPAAPKPEWQPLVDQVLEKFAASETPEPIYLRNEALALCIEWGPMFGRPTQERMMEHHPNMSWKEADRLDRLAREVQSFVFNLCEQELEGKIAESSLHYAATQQYPWLNAANFSFMKNVGMYYARK